MRQAAKAANQIKQWCGSCKTGWASCQQTAQHVSFDHRQHADLGQAAGQQVSWHGMQAGTVQVMRLESSLQLENKDLW